MPGAAWAAAQCTPEYDGLGNLVNVKPEGFDSTRGGMIETDPKLCWERDDKDQFKKGFLSGTICLVQSAIAQSMFNVYCRIVFDWTPIIKTALIVYIMFYAVAFTFGIADNREGFDGRKATLQDAAVRFIKISIIYWLATTPDYFYFWIYQFFLGAMDDLSLMIMGIDPAASGMGVFDYMDKIFEDIVGWGRLIIVTIISIILIIITGGLATWIVQFIMIGVGILLLAFFRVIMTYLTALMALTFLMMFTPIFLSTLLFKPTRRLFDGWIASMISYMLQPVIVLAFLFVIGHAISLQSLADGIFQEIGVGFNSETKEVSGMNMEGVYSTWLPVIGQIDIYFPTLDNIAALLGRVVVVLINIMGFILAWIILNFIALSFIQKIPQFARDLVRWREIRTMPAIFGQSNTIASLGGTGSRDPQLGAYGEGSLMGYSGVYSPGGAAGAVFSGVEQAVRGRMTVKEGEEDSLRGKIVRQGIRETIARGELVLDKEGGARGRRRTAKNKKKPEFKKAADDYSKEQDAIRMQQQREAEERAKKVREAEEAQKKSQDKARDEEEKKKSEVARARAIVGVDASTEDTTKLEQARAILSGIDDPSARMLLSQVERRISELRNRKS